MFFFSLSLLFAISSPDPVKNATDFLQQTEECQIQNESLLYQVTPIRKETIVGHDGKVYKKLHFQSKLHEFLSLNLHDSDKTDLIWKNYLLLHPALEKNEKLQEAFE